MTAPSKVLMQTRGRLGIITLNRPEALNALDLDLFHSLKAQLLEWRKDPQISAIALRGAGTKAFCAGGDVKAVIQACMKGDHAWTADFFRTEYQVDGLIHQFPKPVIALGHGLVLGGGWGLFSGAKIRVASPETQLGMPEIFIGFFPDVGSSYFLKGLKDQMGEFLALSASRLDAPTALEWGLVDFVIPHDRFDTLLVSAQKELDRLADPLNIHAVLEALRPILEKQCIALPPSLSAENLQALKKMGTLESLEGMISFFNELKNSQDPWLKLASSNFTLGSPTSISIAYELYRRARPLSLSQCLEMEFHLALQFCRRPEFTEGVRARLFDKDQKPCWKPAHLVEMDPAQISAHFGLTDQAFSLL